MGAATIKGRVAGSGSGSAQNLTGTQATTILDAFTGDSGSGGLKGLVPAPASGDTALRKFLKADGTWATPGMVLLTSGTVSSAATLDIVLTGYTGFRGLKFLLTGFLPVTDDVDLWMRFSTDGGSTYDTTSYSYAATFTSDSAGTSTFASTGGAGSAQIAVARSPTVGQSISNVAAEGGASCDIDLFNQTNTSRHPAVIFASEWFGATTTSHFISNGGGRRQVAQDVDAVRFLFESGNISAGAYAVYGYA